MKYYVLRFEFLTPVHFGTAENKKSGNLQSFNCCADTFFSALATEAAALDGKLCHYFIEAAQNGSFLLSDLLPYYSGEEPELYVPVPLHMKEKLNSMELEHSFKELCLQYEARREHESLAYIRVKNIYSYLRPYTANGGSAFGTEEKRNFGWSGVQRRMDFRNGGGAYYVSNYTFAGKAGLYVILGLADDGLLANIVKTVELLGLGGIGGRRSSGFGKFVLKNQPLLLEDSLEGDAGILLKMLQNTESPLQMTLSALCPVPEQISIVKQGAFTLLKRSGFVYNKCGNGYEKRNTVYMLKAGSCFPQRVDGQLLEFTAEGAGHPIYRYGKAIYMGLPI